MRVDGRKVEGPDTDWIHLPDPVADAIKGMSERIAELESRVAELGGDAAPAREVRELRPKRGPPLRRRLARRGRGYPGPGERSG